MKSITSIVVFILMTMQLNAGEFNKALSLGSNAPAFDGLDGTDGKKHSLSDYQSKKAVVIVFTCNSCPVANSYEDRIDSIAKKYADGTDSKVALIAINVNTIPEDRLDKMIERAKKKKYRYPYLYDPSQKIAKDYGAMYTPEFFLLDANRKIAYMGSLDDTSKAENVKEHYLMAAIDSVLAGKKPEKGETLARGCKIRFQDR